MAASSAHNKQFEQASKLHAAGEVRKAISVLDRMLAADADQERCLSGLAQMHLQLGENRQAIKRLKALCKLDPSSSLYCDTLVRLYEEAGQYSQAIACYKKLVQHQPEHADSYYNLAQLQTKAGLFADAMDSYQLALEKNISAPEDVHVNLSLLHTEFAQYDEARLRLEKALQENPDCIAALFNLASRDEETGNMELAEKGFNAVLSRDKKYSLALARLAGLKRYSSDDSEFHSRLISAAEDNTRDPQEQVDLNFALGKVLDDSEQYDAAFAAYHRANELQSQIFARYDEQQHELFSSSIIQLFDQRWFEKCKPVSDEKLLFICGMFRSGSTLAEQILAAHSKVSAGGECAYFPRLVNGALSPFPETLKKCTSGKLKLYASGYLDYLSARLPPGQIITDKRPDNFLYLGLIKTLFPNSQFIYTCRQPVDNCLSVFFTQLGANQSYATNLSSIAHYYEQQQRLMKHWQTLFPDSFLDLNYETLLADPRFQIERLLEFCGLDWEEACQDFHMNSNVVSTASAWQVRQPLYTTSLNRSRNYEKHIQPLLSAFSNPAV